MSFFNRHKNDHHHDDHQQRPDQPYPPSTYPPAPSPYQSAPGPYPPAPAPYGQAPAPYGQAPAPYGQAPAPYGQVPAPYGQASAPYGQGSAPYGQAPAPYGPGPATYAPGPASAEQPPYGAAPIQHHTVRIFTKAEEHHSLTVRDGVVVLAPANPRDDYQHWYKDNRWSTKVKDEQGLPAFALINKATGLAIKHALGPHQQVRLIPYNPEFLDESVLWTESNDTGEGFRCIRMVNNTRLNFDAFHGDKDHGGVHDGTTIVLWEWAKGKNQRWKIAPYH